VPRLLADPACAEGGDGPATVRERHVPPATIAAGTTLASAGDCRTADVQGTQAMPSEADAEKRGEAPEKELDTPYLTYVRVFYRVGGLCKTLGLAAHSANFRNPKKIADTSREITSNGPSRR
jgi:hypothetical protein